MRKTWKKVNVWPIKGPILVVGLLLGFFDHYLHWGRAAIAAGVAMIVPIIGFRDFYSEAKFWTTVALLGGGQVLLVIAYGPLMEQLKFPFMLMFGIVDCFVVVLVISWLCSET
jgi:hypothetical protein